MDRDAGTIRQEIDETLERVGDEVEALSYRTDVGARLDDYVEGRKEAVSGAVSGARETVASAAARLVPGSGGVARRRQIVSDLARRNPVGLVLGAVGVGFVIGLALPATRIEDERLGELSDEVKDVIRETGHEAIDRGASVVESVVETARTEGATEGRALADDLKGRLQAEEERPPADVSPQTR